MKRLTKRDRDEYITNCDNCPKHGSCYDSADCVSVLAERLGTYEDEADKRNDGMTKSHSEAAILRGCIALMQSLVGRFEEYLDFIDFHPEDEEERFCTQFYMTEIVKRLFLWETTHSGGTSQRVNDP